MCGIAGYVDPNQLLDGKKALGALAAALAHRGPDGEGFFMEGPIGLAHRRLAIIDLTASGAQPMAVDHAVVVFNGEIYNYRELREELRRDGYSFLGSSDTEVLARAYLHWGTGFVERLRGMWAFAIYDRRRAALLCSRDPFGIKPFYYAFHRGGFIFASEPQALIAAGVPSRVNLAVVGPYLALGVSDHSRECFFEGVHQLGAGETVLVSAAAKLNPISLTDALRSRNAGATSDAELEACLRGSIAVHLRSDVPVGTCLSGGIDSSVVAALASNAVREANGPRFAAVTAASGEERTDERKYARAVVEHCGLAWHVVEPGGTQFAKEIDDCIRAQGEPALSPSIYLQYCVMRQARVAGLKVMLDGQGSDELHYGYERYVPAFSLEIGRKQGWSAALCRFVPLARNSRYGLRGMCAVAAYLLLPPLRRQIVASRLVFMRPELRESALDLVANMSPVYRDLAGARLADVTRFSLPALLRYEDRSSMAHSVEARVPYVDRDVAACALGLPATTMMKDGFQKYPLRTVAARILPASIAWRRTKFGFEPPTKSWLAFLGDRMQAEVDSSTLIHRVYRRVPKLNEIPIALRWRIYNLAHWQRIFAVDAG